jgi:hypothetical protein
MNYVFNQEMNKHALLITITELEEGHFSIRFLLMLHHRLVNATQVSLCTMNRQNMENQPNNTHIPYELVQFTCWAELRN